MGPNDRPIDAISGRDEQICPGVRMSDHREPMRLPAETFDQLLSLLEEPVDPDFEAFREKSTPWEDRGSTACAGHPRRLPGTQTGVLQAFEGSRRPRNASGAEDA